MSLKNIEKFLEVTKERDLKSLFCDIDKGERISVFGMNRAHKIHTVSSIGATVLYIVTDPLEAIKTREGLEGLGCRVLAFPQKEDTLFFKHSSSEGVYGRMKALYALLRGEVDVVVATPEAVMTFVPRLDAFLDALVELKVDEAVDFTKFISKLTALGYTRADYADVKGVFSVRGDVVDVFSPTEEKPFRIEFFDDVIERISYVGERNNLRSLTLLPVTDLLIGDEGKNCAIQSLNKLNYKNLTAEAETRLREIVSDVTVRLSGGGVDTRLNWVIPFVRSFLGTVFDYLTDDAVVVYDECRLLSDRTDRLYLEHANRVSSLMEKGEVVKEHNNALVDRAKLYGYKYRQIAFQQITTQNPIFNPTAVFSFKSTPIASYHLDREALISDLLTWKKTGYTVALCARDTDGARAVSEELQLQGVDAVVTECPPEGGVAVTPWDIKNGLIFHQAGIVVIGSEELLRKKSKQVKLKKKDVFTIPDVGDYVVHDLHGIGVFKGIKRLKTDTERDYVEVEYSDGQVYVPIDQMTMLSRYSGGAEAPKVSKLGGKEFARLKEKVAKSVKAMAFDLLELYSRREESKGYKYPPDSEFQMEFEERFPHAPTQDQITAVKEIKSDMEKGKVMDRLLCGDVGYGKTEVALRAVFKTVLEGNQVAILAPTTILAEQHYRTVIKRFEGYGLGIACLDRFRTPSEVKSTLEGLADGKINIVCGTHRLLSKDVHFSSLGLLVLDEEQRFGVEDKERLKLLRHDVNVLSLSATPIPRTLHMSLTGIRDISVLETPPENRLPVETYVTEYSDALLVDALTRELGRGGQAFVLYNKVESIEKFTAKVSALMPEARIIMAHAQMPPVELEKRVSSFYNGDGDVLVCTTIIENGIDLPNANTLIVYEADKLGLSQLYQLRGRVGRSNRLAYAYFTYPEGRVLTDNAGKRLQSVMDYSELGSGFKIAMRDLEIRGAGNVLGREQHGHIDKIGYDLYCKLLDDAVRELKGEKVRDKNVDVKININAIVPESYVSSDRERMRLYKRIASLSSRAEIKELSYELKDVYGEVPIEVENLMKISYVSNLASLVNVAEVVSNARGTGIRFRGSSAFRDEAILYAVAQAGTKCVVSTAPPSVVFRLKGASATEKLEEIIVFLEQATKNFQ